MIFSVKHIRIRTPIGKDVPIWYIHSEADYLDDPNKEEGKVPGIAPGKERACADQAEQVRMKELIREAKRLEANGKRWTAIADLTWPAVWASLARALPIVNAYAVVPSKRLARVAAPRTAMRTAYPDAVEIIYDKVAGTQTFGASSRVDIASQLVRQNSPALPSPCKVAVLDDWLGRGETFDAMMDRIENDFSGLQFDFIGAFPGVGPTFIPPSNRMQDAVADILKSGSGTGPGASGPDSSEEEPR